MVPCSFPQENAILDPPQGVDLETCSVLPVHIGETIDGTPVCISCWKFTKEELQELQETGRVWLLIWGHNMSPAALTGNSPFQA